MKHVLAAIAVAALAPLLAAVSVYALSELRLRDIERPPPFTAIIPDDPAAIERGRHVARTRGCFGCHGQQLEGIDFDEQWDWPERAVAPNLARYARAHDATTIEAAVRHGVSHRGTALTSMPSYNFRRLSDGDMASLIAFLRSAPVIDKPLPAPALGWSVRWDFARGAEKTMAYWVALVPELRHDAAVEPSLARGEYLALTMCNECHGLDVRGESFYAGMDGGRPTPDLAMVRAYSREAFGRLLSTGTSADGRRLGLMALVAPDRFPELSSAELDDLYTYLTSLAAIPRAEGVPWRPGSPP